MAARIQHEQIELIAQSFHNTWPELPVVGHAVQKQQRRFRSAGALIVDSDAVRLYEWHAVTPFCSVAVHLPTL